MREATARGVGLLFALCYASGIAWVYVRQPQTFAEATGALTSSVGAYRIDQEAFVDGLALFRRDQFPASRLAFARADPAHQDPTTQFYIAYSYYRQGWGRFYNDRDLFARGLEAVNLAIAAAPRGRVVVDDPGLEMRTGDELKAELEDGVQNRVDPLSVIRRHRK